MGKAAVCIHMIEVLNARPLIKVQELGEILGVNPRNIYEYKKELEEAGYIINSVPGKYGGYQLDRKVIFPSLRLTQEERTALLDGFSYLLNRNDFLGKKQFSKVSGKVISAISLTDVVDPQTTVINRFPLAMPLDDLEQRYQIIEKCIQEKKVLEMDYISLRKNSHITVHPYKLFMYNNAWFLVAWNTFVNDYGYFKLNRIQKLEIMSKSFIPWRDFDEHQFIDEFGMKNNGEFFPIELELSGPYAFLIKERIYGKNQTITDLDDTKSILKVEMQNQSAIVTFVLGFGRHCRVIQPEWLIKAIHQETELIQNHNKGE